MFKALKEKVSNEYEKAKVNIQSQALTLVNNGSISSLTNSINENRLSGDSNIRRIDSSASIDSKTDSIKSEPYKMPDTSFSLVDLDEDQPTPQPTSSKMNSSSDSDSFFRKKFFSNIVSNFLPQSDIESEYESESGNLNLDNVSKEQLLQLCYQLKNKGKKYRERWTEVVRAYKQGIEERDKLQNVLMETQDKAIRRVNELKEQCNLEQEAKRHLEENLQVTIEEKEEQIKVLQTKIQLMNNAEKNVGELIDVNCDDKNQLSNKVERLESLLAKCNESLKSNKEKLDILTKENEQLLQYKEKCIKLETEIENIKKLKDSTSSSFAEAKQKLHDELESHKIIIKELKDQNDKKLHEIKQKNNEIKSNNSLIKNLNEKISAMEINFNIEKNDLIEEFSRTKTTAINLLREEYENKIQANNEKFESQLNSLLLENAKLKEDMGENDTDQSQKQINELSDQLEKCNCKLKDTLKQLELVEIEQDNERNSFQTSLTVSESKSKDFQIQIQNLENKVSELVDLEEKWNTTKDLLKKEETKSYEFQEELDSLHKQIDEKNEKIHSLLSEAENFDHRLEEELSKCQRELKSKLVDSKTFEEIKRTVKILTQTIDQDKQKIGDMEKMIATKSEEIQNLNDANYKLTEEINNLKDAIVNKEDEFDKFKSENTSLKKALEISKNLIKNLRESMSKLQNSAQDNGTLKYEFLDLQKKAEHFRNVIVETFSGVQNVQESSDYDEVLLEIKSQWQKLTEKCNTSELTNGNFFKFTEAIVNQIENSCDNVSTLQQSKLQLEEELQKLKNEMHSLLNQNDNLLNQVEEIQRLKSEVNEKDNEISEKSKQLNQERDLIIGLKKNVSELKHELKKDHKTWVAQKNKLEEQLQEAECENKSLKEQLKSLVEKSELLSQKLNHSNEDNSHFLEEITKIKTNAKEILESKHKLNEKFQQTESNYHNLKKDYQSIVNRNKEQEQQIKELMDKLEMTSSQALELEQNVKKLSGMLMDKEQQTNEMQNNLEEMKTRLTASSSQEDQLNRIKDELRVSNERCIEFEERLKMKDTGEQDLRTEVIALEEKLKRNVRNEKELKEELRINEEVNSSLKEQVHKYLSEINQLKNEIEMIGFKHEDAIDKLYKQLEVRESQLDESLMNSNSQYNSAVQDLLKLKSEVNRLNKEIEELSSTNRKLNETLSSTRKATDESFKRTCEQYESQIQMLQSTIEQQKQELAEKMNQFDNFETKLIAENKSRICELEDEINEKNAALSEIHEYYQQRLKVKDNEVKNLHGQLSNPDKNNYQINALQNSILQYHEENSRLKELIQIRQDKANDNRNSDMENCALLGVHLPQPTEYEYLRNILYEFMMGREPVTLSKVIAAVMRFNTEQTDQIVRRQEALHVSKHSKQT